MKKLKLYLRRTIITLPLALIIGTSIYPLRSWVQQALVLFTLIWFYMLMFTEVLGK